MKNDINNCVKIFLIIIVGIFIIPFDVNAGELYTITFNTNGGSEYGVQTIESGKKLNIPPAPIKEGYKLVAWYSDENLTVEYDFNSPVNKDIVLYAKWEESTEEEIGIIDLPRPDIEIYNFDASNKAMPIGEEETIKFTTEIFLEIALDWNEVILYKNNEPFAIMNDSGIDGDELAYDGIYTYQVLMKSIEEKKDIYQVKVREHSSEIINIEFYKPLTEQEITDMETVDNEIQKILLNEKFDDLSDKEKLERLQNKINELVTRNLIIKESIHIDEKSKMINFQYKCGVLGAVSYKKYNSELNSALTKTEEQAKNGKIKIYIIIASIIAISIIISVSTIIIVKRKKRKKQIQNETTNQI